MPKAASRLIARRIQANGDAVRVIRELEKRLCDALGSETLRGLPHLTSGPFPFNGVQIRSQRYDRQKFEEPLPLSGKPVLVIAKDGHIMWAYRCAESLNASWRADPVEDSYLKAEDLEPFTRAVQFVAENHLARIERTAKSYEKVSDFANTLARAIGFQL
jgi:hypothetical protein